MDLSNVKWLKASASGESDGNYIEIAKISGETGGPDHKKGHATLIAMRESKNPDGPILYFTQAEWDAFVAGVKDNEFDID